MKKKLLFLIILLILGSIFVFWNDLLGYYSRISLALPKIEKGLTELVIEKAREKIALPEPLRSCSFQNSSNSEIKTCEKEDEEAFLTRSEVIKWTNTQREKYGLPPLKENNLLDSMADEKVQDMFEKQYFAHESPLGFGVDDLAENFGYQYIAIGENLALGNFENDEVLLQGWMDSHGHRENILNPRYQEIGVWVAKGVFAGKTTWLAVQHFGLPLSACPVTNEALKLKIENNQAQIEILKNALNQMENEIKTIRSRRGFGYEQKINEYNNLVSEYNELLAQTKLLIEQYNTEVKLFNDCVSGEE